jgi:hypothetical protein
MTSNIEPTWDYTKDEDHSDFDADLYVEHARDCECSLCCHEEESE